ncbi:MAG: hypothetical protein RDV48_18225 [Candidatus Eremiobacteraeota bacterium]|nr:hypothetical protein [Candidatus Eremiobacteraeota bacterium]
MWGISPFMCGGGFGLGMNPLTMGMGMPFMGGCGNISSALLGYNMGSFYGGSFGSTIGGGLGALLGLGAGGYPGMFLGSSLGMFAGGTLGSLFGGAAGWHHGMHNPYICW